MQKKKPDVDVIHDLLKETLLAYPSSGFVQSLLQQYIERGGLSKKQLEGLYHKASVVETISPGKLATLQAVILKKHTRYKSPLPANAPLYTKDANTGQLINTILEKYPEHKRVLFLKVKYDNNELLSSTENAELERFHRAMANRQ